MRHPNTPLISLLLVAFAGAGCDPAYEPDERRADQVPAEASSVDALANPIDPDEEQPAMESSGGSDLLAVSEQMRADARHDAVPDPELSADPPEVGGGPMCSAIIPYLNGCGWERQNEGTDPDVSVACSTGNVVSGGCLTGSQAHLLTSRPYENGDPTNGIDDADGHLDGDGWFCEWDAGPGGATHAVVALCCAGLTSELATCG